VTEFLHHVHVHGNVHVHRNLYVHVNVNFILSHVHGNHVPRKPTLDIVLVHVPLFVHVHGKVNINVPFHLFLLTYFRIELGINRNLLLVELLLLSNRILTN